MTLWMTLDDDDGNDDGNDGNDDDDDGNDDSLSTKHVITGC